VMLRAGRTLSPTPYPKGRGEICKASPKGGEFNKEK